MTLRADDLTGAWTLADFRITFSDGRAPLFPFGEDARGLLLYAASGYMSAVLSRAERGGGEAARIEDARLAPAEDKVAAFNSYLSYAGRWSLAGDVVTHHVELALAPGVVGADQARTAHLDGDELVLRYDIPARSGVLRHYALTWQRTRAGHDASGARA